MEIRTLKQLRQDAGIGFNEACRRLGISSAHLMRWERGVYAPSGRYLLPLAELYGVSVETVLRASSSRQTPGRHGHSDHDGPEDHPSGQPGCEDGAA